ncbi:MAG TPA: SufD family Fe-S cluster assembly protein [Firmicutes bacterium]|nr:SufD family Fe-S cluster assembly protein [Bacillota bacterium]
MKLSAIDNTRQSRQLNPVDEQLLETIADLHGIPQGAYNIRKNGDLLSRMSSANIEIVSKQDKPGIDVIVKPGTKNESVHIPVLVTASGLHDLVYNTFDIGEGADVLIVAGCGIHNPGASVARHDGIHEFIVRKGAHIRYVEKHYGQGEGTGDRILNPRTIITLEEGASAEVELVQIRGIDSTNRVTEARVGASGRLIISERLLTHGAQHADSLITVELAGDNASAEVLARSVAQDRSKQVFRASLVGKARSRGHVACDSIIMDSAEISSLPELHALHAEAELTHEAAIGKIAGEQLIKLMTMGLTEKEAIDTILAGFLS